MMSDRVPHRLPLGAVPAPPGAHSAHPPVVLSVDFDFLIAPSARLDITTPLDWTGDEWWPAPQAAARWQQRARDLLDAGVDPEQAMSVTPPDGPARLSADLHAHYRLPAQVTIADSHAYGLLVVAQAAAQARAAVEVVSFDAHHDLGYVNYDGDTPWRSRARSRTSASCDDWLAVALREEWAERATIIYPDWRGLGEWRFEGPTLSRRLLRRVRVCTWEEWRAAVPAPPRPVMQMLCVRSSEWTPPWGGHDQAYLDLCAALAPQRVCLDCDPRIPRVGAHNACVLRDQVRTAAGMQHEHPA